MNKKNDDDTTPGGIGGLRKLFHLCSPPHIPNHASLFTCPTIPYAPFAFSSIFHSLFLLFLLYFISTKNKCFPFFFTLPYSPFSLYKLTLQPLLLLPLLLPSSPTPNFLNYTPTFCSLLPLLKPFSFVLGNHTLVFFFLKKNIYFPCGSSCFFKFLFI